MFLKANHYTPSVMLCKSLQTHQKKGHLGEHIAIGFFIPSRKQIAHKLSGTKGSFSYPKGVPRPLLRHDNSCIDRQHLRGCLYKQGRVHGMRSGPLCTLPWRVLTWCSKKRVTLKVRYIPGQLNVVAEKLSRLVQTIQIELSLLSEGFQLISTRWYQPQIYLLRGSTTNCLTLCHQYQIPLPGQSMHSACLGRIWTDLPSLQLRYWANW